MSREGSEGVCIYSICIDLSLHRKVGSCSCEPMIDALYTQQNTMRFSPCQQVCA